MSFINGSQIFCENNILTDVTRRSEKVISGRLFLYSENIIFRLCAITD